MQKTIGLITAAMVLMVLAITVISISLPKIQSFGEDSNESAQSIGCDNQKSSYINSQEVDESNYNDRCIQDQEVENARSIREALSIN